MRQIGTIENPQQAEQFAAYLTTSGIKCSLDAGSAGMIVWVHEEDRVTVAKEELQKFLNEPNHDRYQDATKKAAIVGRQRQKQAEAVRRQVIDVRDRWSQPKVEHGPLTVGLLLMMMIVGFLTRLEPLKHFEFTQKMVFSGREIFSGEVWRVLTPILLHNGIMHFLFNFLCLRDFGLNIEYRNGTPRFCVLVLVIAALSNSAQYYFSGPFLGGMSGVNYGLFGYIWIRSKLEPESGFWISRQNVVVLFGWLVLCIAIPAVNAANWAHVIGLAVGVAAGASGTAWRSLIGRRW